jgi:hypothetical protein
MKEISSMDFPQHGEVFYFYGQALLRDQIKKKHGKEFAFTLWA